MQPGVQDMYLRWAVDELILPVWKWHRSHPARFQVTKAKYGSLLPRIMVTASPVELSATCLYPFHRLSSRWH
jgi:hypothetical protein